MQAEPFERIIGELSEARFIDTTVVVLNRAETLDAYRQCSRIVAKLGRRGYVLWTDGARSIISSGIE